MTFNDLTIHQQFVILSCMVNKPEETAGLFNKLPSLKAIAKDGLYVVPETDYVIDVNAVKESDTAELYLPIDDIINIDENINKPLVMLFLEEESIGTTSAKMQFYRKEMKKV